MEITNQKYRMSEVGTIPVDWEVMHLGDIANVIGGGTPSTFNDDYWNGDINWFTPTEIGLKKYSYESIRKITKKGLENSSARILPIGTILLTSRAGIGDVSILMNEACTNQGFQSLVAKEELNNEFLYYVVSTLKKVLLQNASGSTFLEISPKKVKSIQVALPSTLIEQTAIATALSDTDALIESLEKLIAKKRNIKQGVMQELLKPTDEWEIKRLGDFIRFQTGFPFSSEYFTDNPIGQRLIKNRDLRSDDSIVYYSGDYIDDFIVQNDDLLIGMDGDFEPVLWKKGRALLNQRVGRVLKAKEISIPFLSFTLVKELKEIEFRTSSTTVKHLSHSDIEKIKMPLPNFEKQNEIATILTDMDAEISALEKKLSKVNQIKQGMMQALLTGKIRLV